jgi:alginate O-acetyltransferase complex protein AlgI
MLIVWAFTGLWHGASWNFVLWGLYYFVLLALEKLFLGRILAHVKPLGWLYTFLAVSTGWVIFAVTDLSALRAFLSAMFLSARHLEAWNMGHGVLMDLVRQYGIYFLFAILFAVPLPYAFYKKHKKNIITVLVLLALFLFSVYKMNTAASNPFLYFRF